MYSKVNSVVNVVKSPKWLIAGGLAILLLVYCLWPERENPKILKGRALLVETLRDPDSLVIDWEMVVGGKYRVRYRAKNGYGGYSNWTYWNTEV